MMVPTRTEEGPPRVTRSFQNDEPVDESLRSGSGFLAGVAAGSALVDPVPAWSQTTTSYSLTELGTLGGNYSVATGVTDAGHVVGMSYLAGGSVWQRDERAFYWSNGTMTMIPTLGGTWNHAVSIHANGDVVGRSQIPGPGNPIHAYLWNSGTGQVQDLNDDLSAEDAAEVELLAANYISENRLVAGECRVRATGDRHPFVMDLNSQPAVFHDLGTVSGTLGWADAVNASGHVVGSAGGAFLFTGASPLISLSPMGYARGINDTGGIVGTLSGGPVYRSPAGSLIPLSGSGLSGGEASDINGAGTVVGYTYGKGKQLGFRWQVGSGAIKSLDSLTPNRGKASITSAPGLSPSGLIAGKALRGGIERACLLTPQ